MKMTMTATELKDTDVEFVSMVKNGANRLPFRVVKSENDEVLDLATISRRAFKKADVAPSIIAVSMTKAADASFKTILKHAGLEENDVVRTERDDLVTYTKKDQVNREGTDVMAVMMKGDVALMVTGLQKGFSGYDWESTDFGTVMGTGGYCTGIATAGDMLDLTIANILTKVESPGEASSQVGAAIDAFKDYCVKLTSGLPVQAFKAEIALAKADVELKKGADGTFRFAAQKAEWGDGEKPNGWDGMDDAAKKKWKAKATKGDWGDGEKPDGWDDMDDDAKTKWKAGKAKKADFDLSKLPAERPSWMPVEKFDALTALKKEAAKKADMPLECPAFMSREAYAALYKAETGTDWPQGDLTQGHGGGFANGAMAQNVSQQATLEDNRDVPKNLGNDTQIPIGVLAVHKSSYEAMKKSGASPEALFAFCKAIQFDPTKDQSVANAGQGDGKGFSDAAMAAQPGTDDFAQSIDEKARRALGMVTMPTKKADGGKNPVTDPAQKLPDNQSGAGAQDASKEVAQVLAAAQKSASESEERILAALGVLKKDFMGQVTALGTRLDDVTNKVAKTEAAISGTVLGDAPGDGEEGRRMQKQEEAGNVPPLLDTGVARYRERNAA